MFRYLYGKAPATPKKESGQVRRFYGPPKPLVSPCDNDHYVYNPKDDIPGGLNTRKGYKMHASRALYVKGVAEIIKRSLFQNNFKGMKVEDFDHDIQLYRYDFLPQIPPENIDHVGRMVAKMQKALAEVYKPMVYLTVILNMMSMENVVYENESSRTILDLETLHMKVLCDIQVGFNGIGKAIPEDANAKELAEFKMGMCDSRLARIIRQYLIIRDYIKLMSYLQYMWNFYADNAAH